MRTIGVLIGNELYNANGVLLNPEPPIESRALATRHGQEIEPMDDVGEIVAMLARIVKVAQTMSADDQRRVRDFVEATRSTLAATTRLPGDDQRAFEMALRNAARQ